VLKPKNEQRFWVIGSVAKQLGASSGLAERLFDELNCFPVKSTTGTRSQTYEIVRNVSPIRGSSTGMASVAKVVQG
jgi:hypothetical protein